jgi:hypothetical protein
MRPAPVGAVLLINRKETESTMSRRTKRILESTTISYTKNRIGSKMPLFY